jgi:hypothetical protein
LAAAPVVPVPKKGSRMTSPGLVAARMHPVQQGLGLLGRVGLLAVLALDPLLAGAQREGPVRAHLGVFVEGLQGVVVEGVALLLAALGGPDQGLVGVGEPGALEVRHRVGLAPDDVVQNPVAQVLDRDAQAEDVVIAADDPDRALVLQDPAALFSQSRQKAS